MVHELAAAALSAVPTAVLLLGDLNEAAPASIPAVARREPPPAHPHKSPAYEALLATGFQDAVELCPGQPFGPASSFVGFFHDAPVGGGRVDHILVQTGAHVSPRVTLAGIVPIDDERGSLPSDHRPVLADVVLEPAEGFRFGG